MRKVKPIIETEKVLSIPGDSPEATAFVEEIAEELLSDVDLYNFLKLYRANKEGFVINNTICRDLIEIATMLYKNAYGWNYRLTGRISRGIRVRARELSAMTRGVWNQRLGDDLSKLSPKMMKHFRGLIQNYVGVEDFVLYIKAFALAEITVIDMATEDHEDVEKFVNEVNQELTKSGRFQEFDDSKPSADFLSTVLVMIPPYSFTYSSRTPYRSALFILRAIYGERTLMEVFNQFPEGLDDHKVLLHVIQNWERVKDYPLEWIEETMSM